MIDSLYSLTRKGWLKVLSFLLASAMFVMILLNSAVFAAAFGGTVPYFAIAIFYGMAILWIHGIGFEIRSPFFKLMFMPLLGHLIVIPALLYLAFHS